MTVLKRVYNFTIQSFDQGLNFGDVRSSCAVFDNEALGKWALVLNWATK